MKYLLIIATLALSSCSDTHLHSFLNKQKNVNEDKANVLKRITAKRYEIDAGYWKSNVTVFTLPELEHYNCVQFSSTSNVQCYPKIN